MTKKELENIGFKEDLQYDRNGIMKYRLIDTELTIAVVEINLKNNNKYGTLYINQYDWGEMKDSQIHLPMVRTTTIKILESEINTLNTIFNETN